MALVNGRVRGKEENGCARHDQQPKWLPWTATDLRHVMREPDTPEIGEDNKRQH